jgi:hypothetical protein
MPARPFLKVAIAGDAIDWYEERILHYPEDAKKDPPQNWQLQPGCDWRHLPGGVLLLTDMIDRVNAGICGGRLNVLGPKLDKPLFSEAMCCTSAFAGSHRRWRGLERSTNLITGPTAREAR